MRRFAFAAFAPALLLGAAVAVPTVQAQMAPAAPRPAKVLIILDAKAFDPGLVLPQPPQEGSDAQQAELAALENIQKARTPQRYAQAQWDDAHEDIGIFSAAIGAGFDLARLPETSRLLEIVRNDQGIIANIAKDYFKRQRPYLADPSLVGCDHSHTKPLTSFPSGHATLGYSLGEALKRLLPAKAAVIQARADDYAYSRLVCGFHYRSDVEASRRLGAWVVAKMFASPALAPQIAAAKAELKAAGLAD